MALPDNKAITNTEDEFNGPYTMYATQLRFSEDDAQRNTAYTCAISHGQTKVDIAIQIFTDLDIDKPRVNTAYIQKTDQLELDADFFLTGQYQSSVIRSSRTSLIGELDFKTSNEDARRFILDLYNTKYHKGPDWIKKMDCALDVPKK